MQMQEKDDFREVKQLVDIRVEIERRTGQAAKQVGDDYRLPECPFCGGHDCFSITPAKGLFKCFQCDNKGSIIDFVAAKENCPPLEALEDLAKSCGYELSSNRDTAAGEAPPRDPVKDKILEAAAAYYHNTLMSTPKALSYQSKTRKHSPQTLKAFRVGYADGNLHRHLADSGFTQSEMMASGLVKERKGSIQDFFIAGLYIYPHTDLSGNVGHLSAKDPRKKCNYQLPTVYRDPGCLFFNMPAFKCDRIMIVEGENDLLSVHGRGALEHVVACCGQLSGAQIDYLKAWVAKGAKKTVLMCFDNDPAGEKYRRKLEQALAEFCLSDRLISMMPEARSMTLKSVNFDDKINDIDDLLKREDQPADALRTLVDGAETCLLPLKRMLALYRRWCGTMDKKASSNEIGEIVFDYFNAKGKYFVDDEKCFLYHASKIHEISSNMPFRSMLYMEAGLNYANSSTKQVIEVLQANAYAFGGHTQVPGWIHTDHENLAIFFNLNNDRNEILKISPGKIEVVKNGTNSDQILLRDSPKMKPLNYLPDVDVKRAMALFKETVVDNLACSASDRFFIASIILNTPMIQFTKARGITKFSGTRASGKTGAAALFTTLVYGQDYVTIGSAAADFSEATRSPVTIQDNLESDSMNKLQRDFLLVSATGITKQKRRAGTDSENVYERVCTQVIVTAIEPFLEGELISRTNDILFGDEHFNADYIEATEIEAKVIAARDAIWSAFFKILANDVLPDFRQKRKSALAMLKQDYPDRSKSRLDELYSCLFILSGHLLRYIPHPEHSIDKRPLTAVQSLVLRDWIEQQNELDRKTASGTNPILYRLTLLVRDILRNEQTFKDIYQLRQCHAEKDVKGEPKEVQFLASSREMFSAFEILDRNRGVKCPYKNARQLSARMRDSRKDMEAEGWTYEIEITVYKGDSIHAWTKTF